MSEIIQDIKPARLASSYVRKPFDEAKEILENTGFRIITAEKNAELRIEYGKDARVSKWGNYVKEGVLYFPRRGRFITRDSLVMVFPKEATQAHKDGTEFYVTTEQAETVLENSVLVPYDLKAVQTNRFGDNEITRFLFGDYAEKYGLFLQEVGMKKVPLYFNNECNVNSKSKPYSNQTWFAGLDYGGESAISGDLRYLIHGTVRGVRYDAESAVPKRLKKL